LELGLFLGLRAGGLAFGFGFERLGLD
jgi:hypothetical protein